METTAAWWAIATWKPWRQIKQQKSTESNYCGNNGIQCLFCQPILNDPASYMEHTGNKVFGEMNELADGILDQSSFLFFPETVVWPLSLHQRCYRAGKRSETRGKTRPSAIGPRSNHRNQTKNTPKKKQTETSRPQKQPNITEPKTQQRKPRPKRNPKNIPARFHIWNHPRKVP